MSQSNDKPIKISLSTTSSQLAEVNRKLLEDDGFRAQFKADPHAALQSYGIEVDPSLLPADIQLPEKADVTGYAAQTDAALAVAVGVVVVMEVPVVGVVIGAVLL